MSNKQMTPYHLKLREAEMSEYYDCPLFLECGRQNFTKRGLTLHLKMKHPEAWKKYCEDRLQEQMKCLRTALNF